MILDRLLVREKLNLLVMIPLVMVVLLLVPLMTTRVQQAQLARRTTVVAANARSVSSLLEQVQSARLLSVAYVDSPLVSASTVLQQYEAVAEARSRILAGLDPAAQPQLVAALTALDAVLGARDAVLAKHEPDEVLLGSFAYVTTNLVDALDLSRQQAVNPADAQALTSLDALLRADEAASAGGAMMLAAASNPVARTASTAAAAVAQGVEEERVSEFNRLASSDARALLATATSGPAAQRLDDASAEVGLAGASAPQSDVAQHVLAAVQTETTLRQLVEGTIAGSVAAGATSSARVALISVATLLGLGLALLALVLWLSVAVGRSVSVPLRRLTTAAGSVADVTQAELQRVADEDAAHETVPRLPAIAVRTRDEMGDLAAAFNRVQAAAALLLERQIASRRNVAAMFAGVGRRTSNLVGRQLALIDMLERSEEDPDTLRTLYRLDHVSTRLRRNSSSLIVLSGQAEAQGEGWPLPLPDAIRAALGSVEDFQRVNLTGVPDLHLGPAAVSDLVLLLAELIENAVLFSPPQVAVEVSAWVTEGAGCAVMIVDQGIGMPADRLAEENERLRQRERLDLAPSDVLGLFVVGRIARRHGLDVTLMPTPGHGVTARVVLPGRMFVERPSAGLSPQQAPAPAAAGNVRGSAVQMITNRVPFGTAAPAPESVSEPLPAALPAVRLPAPLPPAAAAAPQQAPVPPAAWAVPDREAPAAGVPHDGAAVGDLRRRVPGQHWAAEAGAGVGWPGERAAGASSGGRPVPASSPRAPDPEAARRELEDLEAAVARAQQPVANGTGVRQQPRPQMSATGRVPLEQLPRRVPQASGLWTAPAAPPAPAAAAPRLPRAAAPAAGPAPWPSAPEPPRRVPHADAPWRPEPTAPEPMPRLVRRVPGATLAGLEAAAPTVQRRTTGQVGIDAEETLQSLLDIDAAVERARSTTASSAGDRRTAGAEPIRRIPWGNNDGGQG